MPTKLSQLPKDENKLIDFLEKHGPQIIDGKEWFVMDYGRLHYRTIPDLDGQQLELKIKVPFSRDSLFCGKI